MEARPACLPASQTYRRTDIQTCRHTDVETACMHTLHVYMHTCIHAYAKKGCKNDEKQTCVLGEGPV